MSWGDTMPPVREINTNDGLYIRLSSGAVFSMTAAEIQAKLAETPGNLAKKEAAFNQWLMSQEPFVKMYPVSEYDQDHQVNVSPGTFPPWRIIAGAYVGEVIVWVAVHFISTSPLKLIPRCQDRNYPITGEWWL